MKNNFNPYTVPEGFFEIVDSKAVKRHRERVKSVRRSLIAVAAALALLVALPFIRQQASSAEDVGIEATADNLAQMYDYDIFLQVSF